MATGHSRTPSASPSPSSLNSAGSADSLVFRIRRVVDNRREKVARAVAERQVVQAALTGNSHGPLPVIDKKRTTKPVLGKKTGKVSKSKMKEMKKGARSQCKRPAPQAAAQPQGSPISPPPQPPCEAPAVPSAPSPLPVTPNPDAPPAQQLDVLTSPQPSPLMPAVAMPDSNRRHACPTPPPDASPASRVPEGNSQVLGQGVQAPKVPTHPPPPPPPPPPTTHQPMSLLDPAIVPPHLPLDTQTCDVFLDSLSAAIQPNGLSPTLSHVFKSIFSSSIQRYVTQIGIHLPLELSDYLKTKTLSILACSPPSSDVIISLSLDQLRAIHDGFLTFWTDGDKLLSCAGVVETVGFPHHLRVLNSLTNAQSHVSILMSQIAMNQTSFQQLQSNLSDKVAMVSQERDALRAQIDECSSSQNQSLKDQLTLCQQSLQIFRSENSQLKNELKSLHTAQQTLLENQFLAESQSTSFKYSSKPPPPPTPSDFPLTLSAPVQQPPPPPSLPPPSWPPAPHSPEWETKCPAVFSIYKSPAFVSTGKIAASRKIVQAVLHNRAEIIKAVPSSMDPMFAAVDAASSFSSNAQWTVFLDSAAIARPLDSLLTHLRQLQPQATKPRLPLSFFVVPFTSLGPLSHITYNPAKTACDRSVMRYLLALFAPVLWDAVLCLELVGEEKVTYQLWEPRSQSSSSRALWSLFATIIGTHTLQMASPAVLSSPPMAASPTLATDDQGFFLPSSLIALQRLSGYPPSLLDFHKHLPVQAKAIQSFSYSSDKQEKKNLQQVFQHQLPVSSPSSVRAKAQASSSKRPKMSLPKPVPLMATIVELPE